MPRVAIRTAASLVTGKCKVCQSNESELAGRPMPANAGQCRAASGLAAPAPPAEIRAIIRASRLAVTQAEGGGDRCAARRAANTAEGPNTYGPAGGEGRAGPMYNQGTHIFQPC